MRSMLVDVLVALLILLIGNWVFAALAGVEDGETPPAWATLAPLLLAVAYLGWRTIRRGRQRRAQEAERADQAFESDSVDVRSEPPPGEALDLPPMDDYEWRSRLDSSIRSLGRGAFEQFTLRILDALAVVDVHIQRIAYDGAVECIGVHDDAERASVYAVCRRSFGSLGANQVRELRAQMDGATDEGLYISNGDFTASAVDEADAGDALIELVDGDELLDLMHTNRLGLTFDELGRVTGIDDAWFRDLERDERTPAGGD